MWLATVMRRREKVDAAARVVAEPGDGGVAAPGSVGDDGGGASPSLEPEGGGEAVPGAGGGEEEPVVVTLTLSVWPLSQWPWKVHEK